MKQKLKNIKDNTLNSLSKKEQRELDKETDDINDENIKKLVKKEKLIKVKMEDGSTLYVDTTDLTDTEKSMLKDDIFTIDDDSILTSKKQKKKLKRK